MAVMRDRAYTQCKPAVPADSPRSYSRGSPSTPAASAARGRRRDQEPG
jgi:hypothetical protein